MGTALRPPHRQHEGTDGPEGDPDLDGLTNLQEYRSGTDPTDPASRLMFDDASLDDGVAVLRFTAVAGLAYTVQVSEALSPGAWVRLADVAAPPTTRTVEIRDDAFLGAHANGSTDSSPRDAASVLQVWGQISGFWISILDLVCQIQNPAEVPLSFWP